MKKYIITAFAGVLIILSLVLLSACAQPFQGVIEEISSQNQISNDHYLNDSDINNPEYYEESNLNNNTEEMYDNDNPLNNEDNIEGNDNEEQIQPTEPTDINIKEGKDTLIKALVSLSIRSGPGATYSQLGSIIPNAMVPYVAQTNSYWYETIYKGKTAYISRKYSELVYFDKANSVIEKVLDEAKQLLGYPYVYGAQRYHWGNGKLNRDFVMGKFDCSSLTQYAFYKGANILLDLTTRTQVYQGISVEKENLQRGDLMFFTNSSRRNLSGNQRIGHVAIYLGDNYILHTASTYAIIEPISSRRWDYYVTSRRLI